jgi:hypothetical protein
MKQSRPSSVGPYTDVQQLAWDTEAERILAVQKRMQNVSASLLSTTVFQGEPYVIQQLQPVKDTLKFKLLKDDYRDLYQVIDDMANLTASAQLRSGGIQGSSIIDDLTAYGRSAEWQDAMLAYCKGYANQVEKNYRQFGQDLRNGLFSRVAVK